MNMGFEKQQVIEVMRRLNYRGENRLDQPTIAYSLIRAHNTWIPIEGANATTIGPDAVVQALLGA